MALNSDTKLLFVIASAQATSKVGEFTASGFIFKDSVEAVAVEDPDGVLLPMICFGSRMTLVSEHCCVVQ